MENDQKIENLLNLALNATPNERNKSLELNVGYEPVVQRWEVIVKYTGDILRLENEEIQITELSNEYAIVNIPESKLNYLANQPEIEYIEKPKRLYFAVNQGKASSCINVLQTPQENLFGQGILMAVIDSGVDYFHPDFRNPDGSTRILNIWDQTLMGNPPKGYHQGTEFNQDQINEALRAPTREEGLRMVPTRDANGHGTQVLGIAAGNGLASGGQYRGVASKSDIIVVKLGIPGSDAFPRTVELMTAVDYVMKKAIGYQLPIVINLSFGTVYGGHDGTELLETYLDDIANLWKTTIVVGTGNEGAAAGHASGYVKDGQIKEIELGIAENELTTNLQIWKAYEDQFKIEIIHPNGQILGPFEERIGAQRHASGNTELLVYYGEPSPYSISQEIFVDFIPVKNYIDSGVWRIRLTPVKILQGKYDIWLPSVGSLNVGTKFYQPTVETTLTIPSSARKVIAVGAYDSKLRSYASFSGRGYTRTNNQIKPDLAAPGVGIVTSSPGGGYASATGTSFATPFVSGAAAMLMQWGLVEGNDPYLYGEKVRAYLIRGAKPLQSGAVYPNTVLGYGVLCVAESLPR